MSSDNSESHVAGHVDPVRVVFVSTEVAPWSKVGGLADVASALPKALVSQSRGERDVMTVSPLYEDYDGIEMIDVEVPLRIGECQCQSVDGERREWSGRPSSSDSKFCQSAEEPKTGEWIDRLPDGGEMEASVTAREVDKADVGSDAEKNEGPRNLSSRANLLGCMDEGVKRVFVRHPKLYSRDIYAQNPNERNASLTYMEASGDVCDLDERYSIMCQGALVAGALLTRHKSLEIYEEKFYTNGKTVFVLNDWPTALHVLRLKYVLLAKSMQPYLSETEKIMSEVLKTSKTIFCIHSLAYQGLFPASVFPRLCLPISALPVLSSSVPWEEALEASESDEKATIEAQNALSKLNLYDGNLNFMRAALLSCDILATVSPNYAVEIMTNKALGCGFQDVLRLRSVRGIMNGIDTSLWNPQNDVLLPDDGRFHANTVITGKRYMKSYVQERFNLHQSPDAALFVFIGRLTEQKGVDTILDAFRRILPRKPAPRPNKIEEREPSVACTAQIILLGVGDSWLEKAVDSIGLAYPGHAAGICEFSERYAHWLLAAADYVLIPSKFEPCGLIAQCAARYGAIPISSKTGGLKDLAEQGVGRLVHISPDNTFEAKTENINTLTESILSAIEDYGSEIYYKEQQKCMEYDVSWMKAGKEWAALIDKTARE